MAKQLKDQKNEHMLLLEFFVERVVFNDKVDSNLKGGETSIDFQFLDNDPITLEQKPNKSMSLCPTGTFHLGKTCLFSITPPQAQKASQLFDLFIRVFQSKKCGKPSNVLVGIALVPLTNVFREVMKGAGDKKTDSIPGASKMFKNSLPLTDIQTSELVGHICVSVRMSCFGKYIQTDFQMNMDDKAVDYKANEAQYRLKYHKKFEACPQDCGPQTKVPCGDPAVCGLINPPIAPTPMPLAPVVVSSGNIPAKKKGSKSSKGSNKSKGKKGGKKGGKGSKKGSNVSIPEGSCNAHVACPATCPNVYEAMMAKKCKLAQENAVPLPCPPSCYDRDKRSSVQWNDCPSTCPSAPYPSKASGINLTSEADCPPCCPTSAQLIPSPCGTPRISELPGDIPACCPYITTPFPITCTPPTPPCPPPQTCARPPAPPCPQTCPTVTASQPATQSQPGAAWGTAQPQPPCDCEQQVPVTMMYASEPNYGPNPNMDNFQMNMGLGGSLCCRIHEETVPAQTPCPVNYMTPPTLATFNGGPPQSQVCPPSNYGPCAMTCGFCGPPCTHPKQPQILEMRPGLNEETPFVFKVDESTLKHNQMCVCPPTLVAADGTKYTEFSDPKKEVFVMRIGKKYEGTLGGRNNIDLHLTTPPTPLADPVMDTKYQQYLNTDYPPGSTYRLGGSKSVGSGKDKKGGKGGKGGKGKKGGKGGKGKKNGDGGGDGDLDSEALRKLAEKEKHNARTKAKARLEKIKARGGRAPPPFIDSGRSRNTVCSCSASAFKSEIVCGPSAGECRAARTTPCVPITNNFFCCPV